MLYGFLQRDRARVQRMQVMVTFGSLTVERRNHPRLNTSCVFLHALKKVIFVIHNIMCVHTVSITQNSGCSLSATNSAVPVFSPQDKPLCFRRRVCFRFQPQIQTVNAQKSVKSAESADTLLGSTFSRITSVLSLKTNHVYHQALHDVPRLSAFTLYKVRHFMFTSEMQEINSCTF